MRKKCCIAGTGKEGKRKEKGEERWGLTKLCVKDGVSKMAGDKNVRER